MEGLELINFFKRKKIFLTGHTGFKGGWLCLILEYLGATVTGYALQPPTEPSLFHLARIEAGCDSIIADVCDGEHLAAAMASASPEIVIHMAAQSLVRRSYRFPVETYATNVMGTVNVLDAVRHCPSVRAVVVVTTDKVYENHESDRGYWEDETLGGYDPYASSKACAELVTAAYRLSFFPPEEYASHRVAVATVRAGNVIGGGDWADDRLVPDAIRALLDERAVELRNPFSVRPWQHVFEPLSGYLVLAQRLCTDGADFSGAWNFGPNSEDEQTVEEVVREVCRLWGGNATFRNADLPNQPHETNMLRLDSGKARRVLGWTPRWGLHRALASIVAWSQAYQRGADMRAICLGQIAEYLEETGR